MESEFIWTKYLFRHCELLSLKEKKNLICEKENKVLLYRNCKTFLTYFLGLLYTSQQSLVVEDEVTSPD